MDNRSSAQYQKMTQTPIPRLILSLAFPTTVSMLVTTVYNIADTYFVSQLGTSASGAVGIVFGLMAILQAIGFMLGQGAGSILSRSLGAKNVEKASQTASQAFFAALFCGMLITLTGLLFLTPLMYLLGSTDTILPYAATYARYILCAAPFMVASFTMNNIIRYEGRAMYAMIGLMTGGILNIFGDWLLMQKLDFGIAGAGIATALSQFVSFVILLFMFLSGKTQSRLAFHYVMTPGYGLDMMQIMQTGFPSLIRQGLSSIATMLLNSYAGLYGDAAVAGMSIVNRVCFLVISVGIGIGQGFQPVSAFNYGARIYSRVKKGVLFTWLMEEIILGILSVFGIIFAPEIVLMFRDDPDVLAVGVFAMQAQFVAILIHPLHLCSNMLFQSIGRSREASFIASLRNGIAFIPLLLLLHHFYGLTGIELAQPLADFCSVLLSLPFSVYFLKHLPPDADKPSPKPDTP